MVTTASSRKEAEASLLEAVRGGTLASVQRRIDLLEDIDGGDIDAKGFGDVTALHAAAWRGDPAIVKALLDAGASHDAVDAESGFSPLHRAFHFGALRAAAVLLAHGASLVSPLDAAGRSPVDVLSGKLRHLLPRAAVGGGIGQQRVSVSNSGHHHHHHHHHGGGKGGIKGGSGGGGGGGGGGSGGGGGGSHDDAGGLFAAAMGMTTTRGMDGRGMRSSSSAASPPAVFSSSDAGGVGGDLYSWGSGVNFQLGTGAVGIEQVPQRVEHLAVANAGGGGDGGGEGEGEGSSAGGGGRGGGVIAAAAAKFHSVAAAADGSLYAWGHGRGGRLGVDDPRVHSGNEAVLEPRRLRGFGPGYGHAVVAVAAGKHHTLAATSAGELFSWVGCGSQSNPITPRWSEAAATAFTRRTIFKGASHHQ